MRVRWFIAVKIILSLLPIPLLAGTGVEGRVELPKSHAAPVMAKRYEIVTHGGVLSTEPPLAVVYLDGAFSKATSSSTKQIAQKDLTFIPSLLPVLGFHSRSPPPASTEASQRASAEKASAFTSVS